MIPRRIALAPNLVRFALVGLALTGPSSVLAQLQAVAKVESRPVTPGLRETQVTLEIEKDGTRRRFRATVMAKKDDLVTVLTAAHCLSAEDVDSPALLLVDGEVIEGKVLSVVRNPAYRPNPAGDMPGPDSAVARFRFKPANRAATEAFEAIKPAIGLATRAYPGPSGKVVAVRMIDGRGVEHALKAGNPSNPKFLEWGPSYKPIPGDSGGGVFAMSGGSNGQPPRPILIGIIVGRDDNGGMASIVSKEMRWMADELVR
jgi:hypothetical protein